MKATAKNPNSRDWLKAINYSINAKRMARPTLKMVLGEIDGMLEGIFESTVKGTGKLRKIADRRDLATFCAFLEARRVITHAYAMTSIKNRGPVLKHIAATPTSCN
jgi:hypothetical protein